LQAAYRTRILVGGRVDFRESVIVYYLVKLMRNSSQEILLFRKIVRSFLNFLVAR